MFIRQCSRLIKGKRQSYWALVESYRTARGPRQRVVAWLGKLDAAGRLGVLQAAESSDGDSLPQNGSASGRQRKLFDEADSTPEPRRGLKSTPREFAWRTAGSLADRGWHWN